MPSLADRLGPIGAAPPARPPPGALAAWAAACGAAFPEAEAYEVFRVMREGGRPGVKAALNAVAYAPAALRPWIVVEAWAERVAVDALQPMLVMAWRLRSESLLAAAGDTWPELFVYASLPTATLPFVRKLVLPLEALPARFVAYRGGRGDPAGFAAGPSWTCSLRWAAYYACHNWPSWGQDGAPVVLRREVTRAEVLAAFVETDEELVLSPAAAWEVEAEGEEAVAALAAPAVAEVARYKTELAARQAEIMATPEAELWQGWPG